jgi:hypothetical protein
VNGSSVYIAGDFNADFTFDTKLITRYVTASPDLGNLYIAKFTDAGNSASLGWLQQLQASTNSEANAFAVYGTSLYLTSTYTSVSSTMANTTLPNQGKVPFQDVFVAKYTEVGTEAQAIWAQHIGGTQEDEVSALQVSGAAIYLTGNYVSSTLLVGDTKTVVNPEPAEFTTNVHLAKLIDAGTSSRFDLAQSFGSTHTQNRQVSQMLRVGMAIHLAGRLWPNGNFWKHGTAKYQPRWAAVGLMRNAVRREQHWGDSRLGPAGW